jgi:hypothetical protein
LATGISNLEKYGYRVYLVNLKPFEPEGSRYLDSPAEIPVKVDSDIQFY